MLKTAVDYESYDIQDVLSKSKKALKRSPFQNGPSVPSELRSWLHIANGFVHFSLHRSPMEDTWVYNLGHFIDEKLALVTAVAYSALVLKVRPDEKSLFVLTLKGRNYRLSMPFCPSDAMSEAQTNIIMCLQNKVRDTVDKKFNLYAHLDSYNGMHDCIRECSELIPE